jgi:hypothetical protein
LIGDRVRWESCDGTRRGEVANIFNALDASGDVVDFYYIGYSDGFGGTTMAMINETEVHDIEFKVIFRDAAVQRVQYEQTGAYYHGA